MSTRIFLFIFTFLLTENISFSQTVTSKLLIKDFPQDTVLEIPTPEKIALDFTYSTYALNLILDMRDLPPRTPRIFFDYHTTVSLNDSVVASTVRKGWSHNMNGENFLPPETFDFLPALFALATKEFQYQLPPGKYAIQLEVRPQPMEGIAVKSEPLLMQFTVSN
ncbi:hypothetical protein ACFSQD_13620 [Flavihumibacter stibioxidans]|uniref:DUF2271 domain-containing protein n=1 Tax=Flavihumibacter stibioxidans TaxID=1834163 RepID=A0ABR7M8R3_9BACT|nr:hypothetical protein [Flavihumibacter stibioxidans]MBC6491362.1 hypothetical protein [Flavihumibacter stibioxidans]